jgi:TetR/AcrR family transcriptional regulator
MDNKSNLLDVSLDLFSARGYEAVGIQEIVDQAGVTKPTLYHYFGNKFGLLEEVLNRDFTELFARLAAVSNYQHDIVLSLDQIARCYFQFAQSHPKFYRMQLNMQFSAPDSEPFLAIRKYNSTQQDIFEKLFLAAADDHGNMRGRHRIYAATFLGMINTYIGLFLNGYLSLGDDVLHRAVHQFMHGIFS